MFEPGDIFASLMGSPPPSPPHKPPLAEAEEGPDDHEIEAMMQADAERAHAADVASLSPRREAEGSEEVAREADRAAAANEEKRQRAAAAAKRRAAILAAINDDDEPAQGVQAAQPPESSSRGEPEASGSTVSAGREFEPEFVFDMGEASSEPLTTHS